MDVLVLEKCLAFCQGLVETNTKFSLNLSLGMDVFNFNNKELDNSSWKKKKKSPSQLRREKRRKDDREKTKEDTGEVSEKSVSVLSVIIVIRNSNLKRD